MNSFLRNALYLFVGAVVVSVVLAIITLYIDWIALGLGIGAIVIMCWAIGKNMLGELW